MILSFYIPAGAAYSGEAHVIGDGVTIVDAKSYHLYDISNDVSPLYKNCSVTYKLDFEKSGRYKISVKNINFYSGTQAQVSLGKHNILVTAEIPNSNGDKQITEIGVFNILAGETSLTYKQLSTDGIYLSELQLERIGDITEFEFGGNEATEKTAEEPTVSMDNGQYAQYTIESDWGDATYGIYATVASEPSWNPSLKAEFDGTVLADKMSLDAKGWGTFEEIYIGSVKGTGESHSLKITAVIGMRLKSLRIRVVPESVEESFLGEMNNASSHSQIRDTIDKYNEKLIIDYNDYFNKLVYRQHIDSALVGGEYSSLVEADEKIVSLLESEIISPLVTLTQNGKNVTELSNGEFTINIEGKFEENLVAIAGLYSDDFTELKGSARTDVKAYTPASISGLSASADAKKLKIFFLENTTTLRPADYPDILQTRIIVSGDGSDDGTGFPSAPLATIKAALDKAKALKKISDRDITILLDEGEYILDDTIVLDESLGLDNTHGLHFGSLNPEKPAVISGGYEFEGWTDANGDGIYEATLPESITDVRQLYINDYPAQRARSNEYYLGEKAVDDPETVDSEDGFTVTNSDFPIPRKPQYAELEYINKWALQKLPVKSIEMSDDGETVTIMMKQPYYSTALTMVCVGGVHPCIGTKFYLENDITFLDECGEFYFDKDTGVIYYKPFPEENMQAVRTVIGKTEQLFKISGSSTDRKVKNISFNNLKFRHGGYYTKVNKEGAVTFQAENLVDASKGNGLQPCDSGVGRTLEAQILVENAENIEFKDCDISSMGTTALRLGSGVTDSSVTGCIFTDVGGSALSIGTWDRGKAIAEDITLKNNVIARTGFDFMSCPAVSIYYCKNVSTLHNTIAHTPYTAISINWGWSKNNPLGAGGHETAYNHIYDISNSVRDGAHVYNLSAMTSSHVHDNHLTDSPDYGGVYMDVGACNVLIENNVFERCEQYDLMGAEDKPGNVARNNWSDDGVVDKTEWKGTGSSYEPIKVVSDGNWSEEAQSVIDNAGVESAYKANEKRIDKPSWRTLDHHKLPETEGHDSAVTYIHCDTWTQYYYAYMETLTKKNSPTANDIYPAYFYYSGYTAIGNYNGNDWIQYEVKVPKNGKYSLALDYNSNAQNGVDVCVLLTTEPIADTYKQWRYIPRTIRNNAVASLWEYNIPGVEGIKDDSYVPHTFTQTVNGTVTPKLIELNAGTTYYLRFINVKGSFSFSRFKLKLIEEK